MTAANARPLTIRLPARAVERLHERAKTVKGRPTAVVRELILAGLIEGPPREQAERMLTIERHLAAIDQEMQAVYPLDLEDARKLLTMLDLLVDLGNRRAAALQRSAQFKQT